ncbi:hypothetical protein J1605_007787 [Eschrichtius robustus]|uniref:Uncharacterized protein n=1 Tax=Eschrichtius robustus TaxID=9764 RepID=A0AB34GWP5_ESCRO|nr:hypothetical protein J1605_007787 [Eschrichtius robustus]
MESGWPEKDFICKAIAGHKGEIDELAYISTKEYWFDGREKSVVCTVSSDGTVCAWDLQEPAALVNLVTYPRPQLVVTVDERGLIKVWKAENGCEQASCLPTYCDFPEGPLLLRVACSSVIACGKGLRTTGSYFLLHQMARPAFILKMSFLS